jgi:hypothetical protein
MGDHTTQLSVEKTFTNSILLGRKIVVEVRYKLLERIICNKETGEKQGIKKSVKINLKRNRGCSLSMSLRTFPWAAKPVKARAIIRV